MEDPYKIAAKEILDIAKGILANKPTMDPKRILDLSEDLLRAWNDRYSGNNSSKSTNDSRNKILVEKVICPKCNNDMKFIAELNIISCTQCQFKQEYKGEFNEAKAAEENTEESD